MNSEQVKALLDRLESATHEVIVLKAENKHQAAEIERLKEHIEELKDKIRMLKAGFIPEEILDSRSAEIKRLKEENQRLKEALTKIQILNAERDGDITWLCEQALAAAERTGR